MIVEPIQFCPRCGHRVEDQNRYGRLRRVCPSCNYIDFVNPKVAAITLIERVGQILLVKRGVDPERGKWSLPGGYVEAGEDPADAAVREVVEETGLLIDGVRLLDVIPPGGDPSGVIVIAYAALKFDGPLSPADDVDEVNWFDRATMPELAAFPSTQRIVGAWIAHTNP